MPFEAGAIPGKSELQKPGPASRFAILLYGPLVQRQGVSFRPRTGDAVRKLLVFGLR